MQKSGFDYILNDFIENGGIYIGSSAGTLVVGPSIELAQDIDNQEEAPELGSFNGLGIIDFVILPHYDDEWFKDKISKSDMSELLNSSINSRGPVTNLSNHSDEIERLVSGIGPPSLVATDPAVEDPSAFAMEKHLEDFLV